MFDPMLSMIDSLDLLHMKDRVQYRLLERERLVNSENSKSFEMNDYSINDFNTMINFIVDEDNFVAGVDEKKQLYVGRMGPAYSVALFKFNSNTLRPQCFFGRFDFDKRFLNGKWYPNTYIEKILQQMNDWKDGPSRLMILPNDKIPYIDLFVEDAYDKVIDSILISGRDKELIGAIKNSDSGYQKRLK